MDPWLCPLLQDIVFAKPGDAPRGVPRHLGVDRYNDLPDDDVDDDDDDYAYAGSAEDSDDDPLRALAESGVELMEGLEIQDIEE